MARGGIGRIPVSARPKVMQKRGAADRQREARSSYAERRGRTIIRQLVERLFREAAARVAPFSL
jgi:hypothetical protein